MILARISGKWFQIVCLRTLLEWFLNIPDIAVYFIVGDLLEIRFVVVSMNIINLTVAKDILIYMIIHGGNVFVLLRVPKEKTIHKVVRQFGAGLNIFWNAPKNNNHNIDAKADPKQAYIIALGVNDTYRKHPVGDVDTDVNLQDFTKNAQTYAGCYAGIIQRIQTIQPNAKIFVVTRPREQNTNEAYNEVVRRMAILFKNVYVIDLYKYAPSYEKGKDFRNQFFLGGHMNAAGYEYTAWMIMTYIDWIIRNNMKDFEQVAFIGTKYQY